MGKHAPIRADMKNRPKILHMRQNREQGDEDSGGGRGGDGDGDAYPSLFLSMRRGATARTYVHVQIMSRMTRRRD